MRSMAASILLLFLAASVGLAQAPVRSEQLVVSLLAWNGRDYSAVFAPESSDTIYLLAGSDNFISVRKTLVYWWPLTAEWKMDTEPLNVQFPGSLELRDAGGRVTQLPLQEYTYFNIKGDYELNWKVATGEAARRELEKYVSLYGSYTRAMQEYRLKSAAREAELQSLEGRIQKLKEQGKDFAAPLERLQNLPKLEAPVAPTFYVVPPVEMQQAFILNLPPGRYAIRLVTPDGSVMEGSERNVVVHDRLRRGGIGFEVIPSDKWTRPETSAAPSSVLYVNGDADLYLRPFFEDEFNDLAYEKTINNAARGNPTIAKWVRIQQVPHATIAVQGATEGKSLLEERPYFVRQSEGASLGYTIVPFDPSGAGKDQQPDLIAIRVPVDKNTSAISFSALDSKGGKLPGSERQIRVIKGVGAPALLVALALAPLLLMAVLLGLRRRLYASGPRDDPGDH
jgi:hypothetical protein